MVAKNAAEAVSGQPDGEIAIVTSYRPGVKIRSSASGAARPQLEVQIIDNGPGLHPDVADRLFEAFATTKANGMGLGLRWGFCSLARHPALAYSRRGGSHAMPYAKPLNLLDLSFVLMETRQTPMHVAGLQTFLPPPDAPRDFPRQVFEYLRQFPVTARPFNFRLRGPASGSLLPGKEIVIAGEMADGATRALIAETRKSRPVELPLRTMHLKPGMMLTRELAHRDGYLLLAKGSVLTADIISQLIRLEQTEQHNLTLYIRSEEK